MAQLSQFERLAERYFEASYEMMPVSATLLGIHQYDDRLGDFSRPAFADHLQRLRDFRRQLAALDKSRLPMPTQIDYDLVASDVETTIRWIDEIPEWRRNPSFYVDWPLFGVLTLLIRDFAPLEERLRSVIGRLSALGQALAAATENLENPPPVYTQVAIESVESGLDLFNTMVPSIAKLAPNLEAAVLAANGGAVAAYTNYLDFLKNDLLPRSNGDYAIGKDRFEAKLRSEHMLDLTTAQLRSIGQRVYDETKAALEKLAATIDPNRRWSDLVEEARQHHPRADDLLETYRRELTSLRSFIVTRDLVTLPSNEVLEVVETPGFARATTPYAAYLPPAPFEREQKGQFWVTPIDLGQPAEVQRAQLGEHCYASLPSIALHEAYPGHHLQFVWSNNVSNYVRKHVSSSLFAEGWALYCEQLLGDQRYTPATGGEVDGRMFRLFLLKDQLWRAARVLIDVGLHTRTMSVDQAVRLLVDEVKLTEAAARTEVQRYTMTPTQPMSYMMGKLEILRLRDELKLPLHQFHDLLLSSGTIPLKLVREELAAKATRG